jgi:hypothetical protein
MAWSHLFQYPFVYVWNSFALVNCPDGDWTDLLRFVYKYNNPLVILNNGDFFLIDEMINYWKFKQIGMIRV